MRNKLKVLFGFMVLSLLIMRPAPVYADWHGHDHGHSHATFGFNFSFWPDRYYYHPHVIYYPEPDYVVVSPPSYQPIMVNGVTYYLNNGTYYLYTDYGYQTVPPPVQVVQIPSTVVNQSAPAVVITQSVSATTSADTEGSFVVNIPNDKGGYTAVTIKKSGNGFVGPQGEFYSEFPKVSQLKIMYGK